MNEQEIYKTIYIGISPLKEMLDCYETEPLTGMPVLRPDKREKLFDHLVKTMTNIVVREVSKVESEKINIKNTMENQIPKIGMMELAIFIMLAGAIIGGWISLIKLIF